MGTIQSRWEEEGLVNHFAHQPHGCEEPYSHAETEHFVKFKRKNKELFSTQSETSLVWVIKTVKVRLTQAGQGRSTKRWLHVTVQLFGEHTNVFIIDDYCTLSAWIIL